MELLNWRRLFITDGLKIKDGGKSKNRNQLKLLHNYIIA